MKIVYSLNKTGAELEYWRREIAQASSERAEFIPFDHGQFLSPLRYLRAQMLDNLYYQENPALIAMYEALRALIASSGATALFVDNANPYHPEFLRTLPVYKVLRTADGPMSAYDRDFAYVHAFDHIAHHSNAHNRYITMPQKLAYVGAKRFDLWPLAVFDRMFDQNKSEDELMTQQRDVEVVFVGSLYPDKMPLMSKMKKAFGKKLRLHGQSPPKLNAYYNLRYGFPGWLTPIALDDYVPLYQRAKIGINIHLRGKYTVGNYRLFDLPANGVMQISDGGEYLSDFYEIGSEIVGFETPDELIDKVKYYLDHPAERETIARNAYRRVMRDHRFGHRMDQLGRMIGDGMAQQAR